MNEYATFSEGKDLLGSAFLVAVGFGIIIVGFLGIVAALWESVIMTSVVGITIIITLLMGHFHFSCTYVLGGIIAR